jgi:hypothetical protein
MTFTHDFLIGLVAGIAWGTAWGMLPFLLAFRRLDKRRLKQMESELHLDEILRQERMQAYSAKRKEAGLDTTIH